MCHLCLSGLDGEKSLSRPGFAQVAGNGSGILDHFCCWLRGEFDTVCECKLDSAACVNASLCERPGHLGFVFGHCHLVWIGMRVCEAPQGNRNKRNALGDGRVRRKRAGRAVRAVLDTWREVGWDV